VHVTVAEAASDLASALHRGQFGFALLDEQLIVQRRRGALSDWLPLEGEPACASPLLLHMEDAIRALRERDGEIVLPSMRPPTRDAARVTISIAWNPASRRFVIITTPDHGAEQIDRLLASERREKLLLQQQAEAAEARLRVADTLYRDIVECAGDLVLRFRADGRVVFANRRAARFLDAPRDALLNYTIDGLFPPLGQEKGREKPWRLDAYAERPASFEMAARDARGDAVLRPAFQSRHQGDVFSDGEMGEEADFLNDVANAAAQLDEIPIGGGALIHEDVAGGGKQEAIQHF